MLLEHISLVLLFAGATLGRVERQEVIQDATMHADSTPTTNRYVATPMVLAVSDDRRTDNFRLKYKDLSLSKKIQEPGREDALRQRYKDLLFNLKPQEPGPVSITTATRYFEKPEPTSVPDVGSADSRSQGFRQRYEELLLLKLKAQDPEDLASAIVDESTPDSTPDTTPDSTPDPAPDPTPNPSSSSTDSDSPGPLRDPTETAVPPGILPATTIPLIPEAVTTSDAAQVNNLDVLPNVYSICVSQPFELNERNFDDAKVIEFVKSFTLRFRTTHFYQKYGLLASMGYYYLGRPDYRCGLGYSASCSTTCPEVVSNIVDKQLARQVYFTLIAGRHYLQHMEAVDRAVSAAGFTVSQWVPQMSFTFFWWREDDYELYYQMSSEILNSAVLLGANLFMPAVAPFNLMLNRMNDHLQKVIEVTTNDSLQAVMARYQAISRAVGNYEANSATRHQVSMYFLAAFGTEAPVPVKGVYPVPFRNWDGAFKGMTNQLNAAQMGLWIGEVVQAIKGHNHFNVNELAHGHHGIYEDGSSPFSMLLATKSFIQPFEDSKSRYSNFIEHGVTRALQFQLFSMALISQHAYITCTKAFQDKDGKPVANCDSDQSGPQNLKACVGSRVCYMYRWSYKVGAHSQHVEEPHGTGYFEAHPFNLNIRDIIASSVLTYLERNDPDAPHPDNIASLWMGNGTENIYDPSAPGSFTVPVCIRDEENWNTHIKPYGFLKDDWNPWSKKKTFPCVCGTQWGRYTSEFWARTGLSTQPPVTKFIEDNCPAQIHEKIQDPLELFVMDCQLGVQKRTWWVGYAKERHPLCDIVLNSLDLTKVSAKELDPGLRLAMECKLGLVKGRRAAEYCKSFAGVTISEWW